MNAHNYAIASDKTVEALRKVEYERGLSDGMKQSAEEHIGEVALVPRGSDIEQWTGILWNRRTLPVGTKLYATPAIKVETAVQVDQEALVQIMQVLQTAIQKHLSPDWWESLFLGKEFTISVNGMRVIVANAPSPTP